MRRGNDARHTLYRANLLDAEREHVFTEEDFVRLVREWLGNDAEKYLKSIIEERNDNGMRQDLAGQIDDLQSELDDARNELDDLRSANDKLEAILDILNS